MTPEVYLASSSPRRRELLAQLGVRFAVIHPHVDERYVAGESPGQYVARLALAKAHAGRQLLQQQSKAHIPVIGADTCVVVGEQLIGKPNDKSHYDQLLKKLSGATHQVYSAVAIAGDAHLSLATSSPIESEKNHRISCSTVTFRKITDLEREIYWQSGEPLDKAGGYAIQGLAAAFVTNISGSYSGIVGLPLFETAQLLKQVGIEVVRVAPGDKE